MRRDVSSRLGFGRLGRSLGGLGRSTVLSRGRNVVGKGGGVDGLPVDLIELGEENGLDEGTSGSPDLESVK